jgi:hypothetical protein
MQEEALFVEGQARRAVVGNLVQAAIEADPRPRAEREKLLEDLNEFLDQADNEIFLDLPIGQLAQMLCRDWNVPVDLDLWRDKSWAQDEASLRARGSPFIGLGSTPADPMAKPP